MNVYVVFRVTCDLVFLLLLLLLLLLFLLLYVQESGCKCILKIVGMCKNILLDDVPCVYKSFIE